MAEVQYIMRARVQKALRDSPAKIARVKFSRDHAKITPHGDFVLPELPDVVSMDFHRDCTKLNQEELVVSNEQFDIEVPWEHVLKLY